MVCNFSFERQFGDGAAAGREPFFSRPRRNRLSRIALALVATGAAAVSSAAGGASFHFDFGTGSTAAGYVRVSPNAVYSKETGYGFDLGTKPSQLAWGVTGAQPFFFSVTLPEGNYRVVAILGDSADACVTTVKA